MPRIRPPFKRSYDPLGDTTDSEFDFEPQPPTEEELEGSGVGWGWATTFPEPTFCIPFSDAGAGRVNITETFFGATPTFTRATTATTVLANGLVASVASGVPRSYYDPTSGEYLGYLAEGARTNLLLRSEDTTNASWTKVDTTPTLSGTGPDGGTNTANLLTEGAAGTARLTQSVTATADANYSVSRFFKRGNTDWVILNMGSGANEVSGWFNLATGAVGSITAGGTGVAGTISIQAFPNGWYRATITGSVGNGATSIAVNTLSANANGSSTRVANSTRLEWGAQFENNVSFASSYIPTTTATVTRNADVLTYPFTANTGTSFAQAATPHLTGTNRGIFGINDGTATNQITIQTNTSDQGFGFVNATTTQAAIARDAITANTSFKFAFAFASNDFAASMNGGAVGTDTSGTLPSGISMINVGNSGAWFGTIRRIAYWPTRLSNADLQYLTRSNSPF